MLIKPKNTFLSQETSQALQNSHDLVHRILQYPAIKQDQSSSIFD